MTVVKVMSKRGTIKIVKVKTVPVVVSPLRRRVREIRKMTRKKNLVTDPLINSLLKKKPNKKAMNKMVTQMAKMDPTKTVTEPWVQILRRELANLSRARKILGIKQTQKEIAQEKALGKELTKELKIQLGTGHLAIKETEKILKLNPPKKKP